MIKLLSIIKKPCLFFYMKLSIIYLIFIYIYIIYAENTQHQKWKNKIKQNQKLWDIYAVSDKNNM